MEWIKRRGKAADIGPSAGRRRWERTGFSWLKRDGRTPTRSSKIQQGNRSLSEKREEEADNWDAITSPGPFHTWTGKKMRTTYRLKLSRWVEVKPVVCKYQTSNKMRKSVCLTRTAAD